MTQELKPTDLKVGDVIDVSLHRLKVVATKNAFGYKTLSVQLPNMIDVFIGYLHSATITRSPEVIEAGDVVRHKCWPEMTVEAVSGKWAWCNGPSGFNTYPLSDLTLVSKGAKS